MNHQLRRPIAIYLPQFHPVAENNEWWGEGFTEWTNVTRAVPAFEGHYQPHLPANLGFYDLRVPETRAAQAEMARKYGIYGFCYYHYWFNGRRILERPFTEVFESGKPDFPFMLCWANENWTRKWDGGEHNILLRQDYSEEDDRAHIKVLLQFFKDPRYIKIDGKPVFAVYRSSLFPDMAHTIKVWRQEAEKAGMQLYLCHFETFGAYGAEPMKAGFDAAIDFPPHGINQNTNILNRAIPLNKLKTLKDEISWETIRNSYRSRTEKIFRRNYTDFVKNRLDGVAVKYADFVEESVKLLQTRNLDYKIYPCITPCWDNYARRKKGFYITHESTPELYEKWLQQALETTNVYSPQENLFFINAWNEWAEGNHLEPDQKWGFQYLEATHRAFSGENAIAK